MARRSKYSLFTGLAAGLDKGVDRHVAWQQRLAENELAKQRQVTQNQREDDHRKDQLRLDLMNSMRGQSYVDPRTGKTVNTPGTTREVIDQQFPGVLRTGEVAVAPKTSSFNANTGHGDAEKRRYQMQLAAAYEKAAKPFADTVQAYQDARGSYQNAMEALKKGQSSTVYDKNLVLANISSKQGSRISDKDFEIALKQGSVDEQWANMYSMAVKGQMTPQIRDALLKEVKGAVISREKEYKTNVEDQYTKRALSAGIEDTGLVVRPIRPVDWETEFSSEGPKKATHRYNPITRRVEVIK